MICQIDFELLSMELWSAEWTELWMPLKFDLRYDLRLISFTFYSFVPLIPFSLFIVETKRMRSSFTLCHLFPPIDIHIVVTSSNWWGLSCAVAFWSVRYSGHFLRLFFFYYSRFASLFLLIFFATIRSKIMLSPFCLE